MMCDLTVLVVPRRIRRSEVDATVGVLDKFGARPTWMILVAAGATSPPPARHAEDAPASPAVANGHAKPGPSVPLRGPDGRFKAGMQPRR